MEELVGANGRGEVVEMKEEKGRMKVDKDVQERLVENLSGWLGWLDILYDNMKSWINKIEKAETVEDVMKFKRDMLLDYLDSMPIGPDECYFCLLHQMDCEEAPCEYGMVHGFCSNEDSDHREIRKLVGELRQVLEERYYRGESYPDTY